MTAITQNQLIPETIDIRQNGDDLILTANGEELHIDHIVRLSSRHYSGRRGGRSRR